MGKLFFVARPNGSPYTAAFDSSGECLNAAVTLYDEATAPACWRGTKLSKRLRRDTWERMKRAGYCVRETDAAQQGESK